MARVSYVDIENPAGQLAINQEAETALFGRPASINGARILGHVPLIARFIIPQIAALQRNGAGSILPAKLKAMADIKTSVVNSCSY